MSPPGPDEAAERTKVLDAAVRCFERYGPQRTSMNDIADEAGISRRTLYRLFDDRPALVAELLDRRVRDLRRTVNARLATYADIEEALVEGSLAAIEDSEADSLLSEIVRHEHAGSPERFLLRVNDTIAQAMVADWSPLLDRGRAVGRVRADLTNERAVDLIMTVHAVALLRDDLGRDGRRALFRDLLVAAVLVPPPAAT
ncbi:MAG: helix-turn-helix domain-containing protein [Actinomycetota bacterium]